MSRARILLVLLLLLGCAVYYSWNATPRQKRVEDSGSGRLSIVEGSDRVGAESVGLDFSGGESLKFQPPRKDLFGTLYEPPKIVEKPLEVVRKPVIALPPPLPVLPPPIDRPLTRPVGPKPIPALKVMGYLEKGAQRTVFLTSRQGDIYLVKRGERFADGLLVRELDTRQITISRGQADPGISLPIEEAKTQRIPDSKIASDRPGVPPIQQFEVPKRVPEVRPPEIEPGSEQNKVNP